MRYLLLRAVSGAMIVVLLIAMAALTPTAPYDCRCQSHSSYAHATLCGRRRAQAVVHHAAVRAHDEQQFDELGLEQSDEQARLRSRRGPSLRPRQGLHLRRS